MGLFLAHVRHRRGNRQADRLIERLAGDRGRIEAMSKRCELYLRLRADALPAPAELEELAREIAPAALLLTRLAGAPADGIRRTVEAAKRQNLAILLEDDFDLAGALDADGVHLRGDGERIREARRLLGEQKSIGASCALSRHNAMELAEAGADYIAFGEMIGLGGGDIDALAEMIRWWDELVELPSVAWLDDDAVEDDARRLRRAGADFLAVAPGRRGAAIDMTGVRRLAAIAGEAPDLA
jgi:thiamine-phosphate pyrophosphorylase